MSAIDQSSFYSSFYHRSRLDTVKALLSPTLSNAISDELLENILSGTLDKLSLERLAVNNSDLNILLSYCPHLKALDLSECPLLTDEALQYIPADIEEIYLLGIPGLTENIFDYISRFKLLKVLDLSKTNFDLHELNKLEGLQNLEVLYFWECRKLKDKNLMWLKDKEMKTVEVSKCICLSDVALTFLKKTQKIILDGLSLITDEGLNELFTSNYLKELSLYSCPRITKKSWENCPAQTKILPQASEFPYKAKL